MTIHERSTRRQNDVTLTENDFARIAKIAKSNWGLNLETAKIPLIRSRLGRRLTALELDSFSAYCQILERGESSEAEHFISALTTNVTNFYREIHHFEFLESRVFPELIKGARSGKKVRIWSAGCSTGQEPYSIAGSLTHIAKDVEQLDIKILATDVDKEVIKKAESGIYRKEDCGFPNPSLEKRIFTSLQEDEKSVKQGLRNLVSFRQLNLMAPWPMAGKFDVIMCRNVAIYFDKLTQERLWSRFASSMSEAGYLFIGHSERIGTPSKNNLAAVGITSYQLDTNANKTVSTSKG